jgi:hypothetical protein
MLATAHALVQTPDVPTTTARTRIGIVALDLAETLDTHQGESLRAALVALAATDAYAAQDVLTHRPLSRHRTASQSQSLHDLVRACPRQRPSEGNDPHPARRSAHGCNRTVDRHPNERSRTSPARGSYPARAGQPQRSISGTGRHGRRAKRNWPPAPRIRANASTTGA